ncbi:MAG TPA: hypothetical protein VMH35_02495 [Streptosporangiaceae bacterium]|nr:hypothetical protein [Streptosporangiaceae bacterium]
MYPTIIQAIATEQVRQHRATAATGQQARQARQARRARRRARPGPGRRPVSSYSPEAAA